jgi:serine protease DegQ
MTQLIRYGEVRHGHIGVAIQDLTPDLARALGTTHSDGALVARVEPGSAAQLAGLRASDLIVAVDGTPIHNASELKNRIGLAEIGDEVQLSVDRGGTERTLRVRIDQETAARQSTARQYLGRR